MQVLRTNADDSILSEEVAAEIDPVLDIHNRICSPAMKTRQSSKRGHPPDDVVASRLASLRLSTSKTLHTLPCDEIAPETDDERVSDEIVPETDNESDQERDRPLQTWVPVKQRLREAFGLLRTLLFIHTKDERVCLRLRGFLQFHHWSISWLALLQSAVPQERSLSALLQDLDEFTPENKREELKQPELQFVLSALLAFMLCGDIIEFRPLQEKLSDERWQTMKSLFGEEYRRELSSGGRLFDIPGFRSWFTLRKREPQHHIDRSLTDLNAFQHVREWSSDQPKHDAKCEAFSRHSTRAQEMTALTVRKNTLNKKRKERQQKKTWMVNDEQEYERALQEIKQQNKSLLAEKKLMIRRTRKYRMFPTRAQRKTLKQYMGTCRWTYNQAVAHFRATNEFNAERLRDLYVTKKSRKTHAYPEGMSPPPEWVFDTPKNLRFNTLRTFQTNVKSALSNMKNGNIKQFKIDFSSKKKSPSFTISQDGTDAAIREDKSAFCLSISKLKNIRVKMDAYVDISCEIDILNNNGFWYVAIPEYVEPTPFDNRGKCVALDPGIKAFMTGMDLDGNVLEFGRGTKTYLKAIRKRRDAAQSMISKFKNEKGKTKRWKYREYVRAKRTFSNCTAKIKNCVKELHYQTCSYLVKHYDVILLPIFQTKDMVKKSSARNHGFNTSILSLNHFQFRQLLQAKCEIMGKTVMVCSEMYTSRTCARCERLHFKLGSNDVFTCPHCSYTAGRDEQAAFNILRYVCAGSLQTYA